MLMRYHWGIGIGHIYSHDSPTASADDSSELSLDECSEEEAEVELKDEGNLKEINLEVEIGEAQDKDNEAAGGEDSGDDDAEGGEDLEPLSSDDENWESDDSDATLLAMDEMYPEFD